MHISGCKHFSRLNQSVLQVNTWSRRLWAALLAEFLGTAIFEIYGGNAPNSVAAYGNGIPLGILGDRASLLQVLFQTCSRQPTVLGALPCHCLINAQALCAHNLCVSQFVSMTLHQPVNAIGHNDTAMTACQMW